jgi:hypothetical protein
LLHVCSAASFHKFRGELYSYKRLNKKNAQANQASAMLRTSGRRDLPLLFFMRDMEATFISLNSGGPQIGKGQPFVRLDKG